MPTNVVMPQMGESITEGTIVRWLKEVGDAVEKDEPLLEISTDKVDAEVPSPVGGKLLEIKHGPGDTVEVETVIAVIGAEDEEVATAPHEAPKEPGVRLEQKPAEKKPPEMEKPAAQPQEGQAPEPKEQRAAQGEATPAKQQPEKEPARREAAPPSAEARHGEEEGRMVRRRSSPLVRRIASEHGVDLALVPGTGVHGRVTKHDILSYIEESAVPAPTPEPAAPFARPAAPVRAPLPSRPLEAATLGPSGPFAEDERREEMSIMRRKIAEHMVASKRTSPHVHTVFEFDMSRVVALRERNKAAFESQYGLKLTYTPFFMAAVVEALEDYPIVNASLEEDRIVYHRHVNLGVAVALDRGLIVPVVRHAEERSVLGLQRAITDLATRARNKQLKPDEVGGSTFSITNPGPYGGLFGLPVINQPNVAILHVGNIHRRPLVVTDDDGREAIAICDVAYCALSFDHRLIDGATADMFMARLKQILEAGEFDL
jgi:pyruvate dehydrogenase E2 component (dihydrolipoamide acetyltransferase)